MSKLSRTRISALEATLRRIEKKHGKVTPKLLVAEAEPEKHPLHSEFEWDDSIAGPLYREDQARTLIRSVEYVSKPGEVIRLSEAPFYVRNPNDAPEQGYISLDQAKLDAQIARGIVMAELARIEGLVRRGRAIAHQLDLEGQFDSLLAQIIALRAKLLAA